MGGSGKRNRSSGGLGQLGEALGNMRLPQNVKSHLQNSSVWTKWSEIVGTELCRVTSPRELKGKTLIIEVAHQAWAQQLHFLKPSLLGKIRHFTKKSAIENLEFRVGAPRKHQEWMQKLKSVESTASFSSSDRPVRLSERQEMTLRAVDDPELRDSIRRAMEAEARRQA